MSKSWANLIFLGELSL